MNKLTFKQYLGIVNKPLVEDTAADVQNLQAQISALDARIAQQNKPLLARKQQLQTMLAQKQEQLQAEQKKAGTQANPQAQQGQQMQANNQTTTPGSAGAATPGSASQTQ